MISTCSMGKNFLETRGVNKVSCRRGDLDFTLQEGGNGTLSPPHAHVCDRMIFNFPGVFRWV